MRFKQKILQQTASNTIQMTSALVHIFSNDYLSLRLGVILA